jgi:hypothetical protein
MSGVGPMPNIWRASCLDEGSKCLESTEGNTTLTEFSGASEKPRISLRSVSDTAINLSVDFESNFSIFR